MHTAWVIRGGRIVDPANRRDETACLCLRDGVIVPASDRLPPDCREIDARGLVITPGFVDLHVHFREPGDEDAETVESGSRAAARGGFTTVLAMPNTRPPVDTPQRVSWLLAKGAACGLVRLKAAACITSGRAGRQLADLPALAAAGAAAFTDDGTTVADDDLMTRAMQTSAGLGRCVMDHALDPALAGDGVMHRGEQSRRLGLPGIPPEAEIRMVRRDLALAARTGCAVHIQHVSTAETVDLLRAARAQGLPVSGEATPHHLAFADVDVRGDDANFKMNPPLRTAADREAIQAGVADGTLQALATDHAPHTALAKAAGMRQAPFGVVGLETAVGVTYRALVETGALPLADWVSRWTTGPAAILGLPTPSVTPGRPADLTILDLHTEWTVEAARFVSRSANSPFVGCRLKGRAAYTFCSGRLTWQAP